MPGAMAQPSRPLGARSGRLRCRAATRPIARLDKQGITPVYLQCDPGERRKHGNVVRSLNKAPSLFRSGTEIANDRGAMLRAPRGDAACPLCTEPDARSPYRKLPCQHLELKSSSSISGTTDMRVRRIEAVRVFGIVDQSNFYQLIV
jgi:hypothetical protein